jgi:hypothetical protein
MLQFMKPVPPDVKHHASKSEAYASASLRLSVFSSSYSDLANQIDYTA